MEKSQAGRGNAACMKWKGSDRLTLPSAVSGYAEPHHQNGPAAAFLLSGAQLTWQGNLTTEAAHCHV